VDPDPRAVLKGEWGRERLGNRIGRGDYSPKEVSPMKLRFIEPQVQHHGCRKSRVDGGVVEKRVGILCESLGGLRNRA